MSHWRPASGPAVAQRRAAMLQRLRRYFLHSETLEVDTPALSRYAASDTQIESLEVSSKLRSAPLYLQTSPEFCMKRLLAAGYPDIYSICRVFRDGEAGKQHQPEFTMVEWYRLGMSLDEIVADTIAAIAAALDSPQLGDGVTVLEYRSVFRDVAKIDPVNATIAELGDAADADSDLRVALGDKRGDWLDLILTTRIVPTFTTTKLTVLRHYLASQAALARICPADTAIADRFEVFLGKLELANGYVELTDAAEQEQRIAADQDERRDRGLPLRAHDELLLAALQSGLPACAGVAMGLERLQMVHAETDDIRDVLTFTFEDNND
ncbi:MAG: EF-P lysine aminoacylase GenX [Proteobacteria bacterium]|nr:EF-P lysine aminoacylase GenX [Pseudomonadota bacterium]